MIIDSIPIETESIFFISVKKVYGIIKAANNIDTVTKTFFALGLDKQNHRIKPKRVYSKRMKRL
jgi:hypothetical protein